MPYHRLGVLLLLCYQLRQKFSSQQVFSTQYMVLISGVSPDKDEQSGELP